MLTCINPTTEAATTLEEFPLDKIAETVRELRKRSIPWRDLSPAERTAKLARLPELLDKEKGLLVALIGRELGKPKSLATNEVERTIDETKQMLERAAEWLEPEKVTDGYVEFSPLGVAAVISPWNFPVMLPLRGILPALLTGNAVVFKPSELTPETGKVLAEMIRSLDPVLREAMLLIVGGKDHGRAVVDSDVDLISFTGSTAAGKHIAKVASEKLKRVLLELGGLDAAVVLDDVDVAATAEAIVKINSTNTGQVCSTIKRVFVDEKIYPKFVEAAIAAANAVTVGAPEDDPAMGPIVSKTQLERVETFVEDARKKGAKIETGGKRKEGRGYFYPSTVITGITDEMRLTQEEPFGPVLPIVPIKSAEEGIERANETRYGLTASIWTKNAELGKKIAAKLDVGTVSLNSHRPGGFGTPWGGAKESGIGRMKTKEGLREFTNVKLVRW